MRTIGEIDRDARGLALLLRCADALDAIAGTLAAIHDALKPPEVLEDGTLIYPAPGETPADAIDAVVANPKMNTHEEGAGE